MAPEENASEPSPSMVAFFEQRTRAHIERVRHCLNVLADETNYAEELRQRAQTHDASKFGADERIPYIWLTEYHRRRRNAEHFEYPPGMEQQVRLAVHHHVTTNRHHPEFHSDVNEMTDVDLIEMVCDWTAMAQEFGEPDGSARHWANKTIGDRIQLNDERRDFVYRTIDLLDSLLGREGQQTTG